MTQFKNTLFIIFAAEILAIINNITDSFPVLPLLFLLRLKKLEQIWQNELVSSINKGFIEFIIVEYGAVQKMEKKVEKITLWSIELNQ